MAACPRQLAVLVVSQWITHRDPRFFDEPQTFRPERWADDLARRLPRFAYFPFGGGPRQCIGSSFAMLEAVLLLAPDQAVIPYAAITLRPRQGLPMVLRQR